MQLVDKLLKPTLVYILLDILPFLLMIVLILSDQFILRTVNRRIEVLHRTTKLKNVLFLKLLPFLLQIISWTVSVAVVMVNLNLNETY